MVRTERGFVMSTRAIVITASSILAILLMIVACTSSSPDLQESAVSSGEDYDEEAVEGEAEPVEDAATALPDEEEEGGGGIISGGVKPDDGKPKCDWLEPEKGDPKGMGQYGCRGTSKMKAGGIATMKLVDAKGKPVKVYATKRNFRGYDVVFFVRAAKDSVLRFQEP